MDQRMATRPGKTSEPTNIRSLCSTSFESSLTNSKSCLVMETFSLIHLPMEIARLRSVLWTFGELFLDLAMDSSLTITCLILAFPSSHAESKHSRKQWQHQLNSARLAIPTGSFCSNIPSALEHSELKISSVLPAGDSRRACVRGGIDERIERAGCDHRSLGHEFTQA